MRSSTCHNDIILNSLISRAAVATVQVSTLEWIPNAFTGRSFAWYLCRVYSEIERLFLAHGSVSLVAHSQGGILALICLGPHRYDGMLLLLSLFPYTHLSRAPIVLSCLHGYDDEHLPSSIIT